MDISAFCTMTLKRKMSGSKNSNRGLNGKKSLKKFLRKAREFGFFWEIRKSGHIHIRHVEIGGFYTTSSTPDSQDRWVVKTRDQLNKRFGILVQ